MSPSEAARTLFTALEDRAWSRAAALVDSSELVAFREQQLDALVAWAENEGPQAEAGPGGMRGYSVEPGAREALSRYRDVRVTVFSGVSTVGELAALPQVEFLARWIEATQRVGGWGNLGPGSKREVLGHVLEGDSLAHVVYRFVSSQGANSGASGVETISFRRRGPEWRPLVNKDLVFEPSVMMQFRWPERR